MAEKYTAWKPNSLGKVRHCSGCRSAFYQQGVVTLLDNDGREYIHCPYCLDEIIY